MTLIWNLFEATGVVIRVSRGIFWVQGYTMKAIRDTVMIKRDISRVTGYTIWETRVTFQLITIQ